MILHNGDKFYLSSFFVSTALNFIKFFFYTFSLPIILCNLCFDFGLNVKFNENNAEKAFDVIK